MECPNLGDNWAVDKLGRKEESEFLTSYLVSKYEQNSNTIHDQSFVFNINAEWGFGKTYFLKNWADSLSKSSHPVVYFDAWQNDFSNEPLVAFISNINEQLKKYIDNKIDGKNKDILSLKRESWIEKGRKLVTPYAPLLLSFVAKKITGYSLDEIGQLIETNEDSRLSEGKNDQGDEKELVSSLISRAAQDALERHNSTNLSIQEFKNKLGEFVESIIETGPIKAPIFIFVDELDRCRPNYSIELLEKIKHLFGVRSVFFVIATASTQLCESIKKVYGHNFDSQCYLRRFFDQTYTLQKPTRDLYSEYLFQIFNLNDRKNLFSPLSEGHYKEKNLNSEIFYILNEAFDTSLRDMYQYCIILDCISLSNTKISIHTGLIVLLLIFRDKYRDKFYEFMRNNEDTRIYSDGVNVSNICLKCLRYTDHYHASYEEVSIKRFIDMYITNSFRTKDNIRHSFDSKQYLTTIELNIMSVILREDNVLNKYAELIDQAGRVS